MTMIKGDFQVKRLDHHGIVAGVIRDLGIDSYIDQELGSSGNETVSIGQAVSAMIINGLGYTDKPLSMTTEFFEQLPTEDLLGTGIEASSLNRHRLGRALDEVYEFGCTKLFSELAGRAVLQDGVELSRQALDTTSFNLTGSYDSEFDTEAIQVVHGYSKDHRSDLKQVITELIVSHDSGVPLFFKAHDGNKSDSKIFRERCKQIIEHFQENKDTLLSADSKLYSEDNAENLAQIGFVTRIPSTLNELKAIVSDALGREQEWQTTDKGIKYQSFRVKHYDIEQNWFVCYSEQSQVRAAESIVKAVVKEGDQLQKKLFHLQAERFFCEQDALKALDNIKTKFHSIKQFEIIDHPSYTSRGRPKLGAKAKSCKYQIVTEIEEDIEAIKTETLRKACFVLGTNRCESSATEIIDFYKQQNQVELGFRFLKSPIFYAQSFYLKKPERIEALLMVMTLSLLVYSIAQRRIRKALANKPPIIANSSQKPTTKPTLNRVFQVFQGISIVISDEQKIMTKLKNFQKQILEALGIKACEMYGHHFAVT